MSKVLVIGASEKTERYSNRAIRLLNSKGHQVLALGRRSGEVDGIQIDTGQPVYEDLDTISLYVGPQNQHEYEDYILSLNPRRVIFNPGTENAELSEKMNQAGIETEDACTLVLLSLDAF